MPMAREQGDRPVGVLGRGERDHADAAVQRPLEVLARHAAGLGDQAEDRRQRPGGCGRASAVSSTGRTRSRLAASPPPVMCDIACVSVPLGQVEAGLGVDPGRLEQLLAERAAEVVDVLVEAARCPPSVPERAGRGAPASSRWSAGRSRPSRPPTSPGRTRPGPRSWLASTTPVVEPATSYSSGLEEPGVLGGLAADERAAGGDARLGDALDDGRDPLGYDAAGGDVVGQEQRLGAADDEVVDEHADQVEADRVVLVERLRDRDLGADAVGRGGQQRLVVGLQRAGVEEPGEPADAADHLRAAGLVDPDLHQLDGLVAGLDGDSGGLVRRSAHRHALRSGIGLSTRRQGRSSASTAPPPASEVARPSASSSGAISSRCLPRNSGSGSFTG